MYEDSVLKELRETKDRIAANYDYDVHKLLAAMKKKQDKSGQKVVTLKSRQVVG